MISQPSESRNGQNIARSKCFFFRANRSACPAGESVSISAVSWGVRQRGHEWSRDRRSGSKCKCGRSREVSRASVQELRIRISGSLLE